MVKSRLDQINQDADGFIKRSAQLNSTQLNLTQRNLTQTSRLTEVQSALDEAKAESKSQSQR